MALAETRHRAELAALLPIRWLVPGNCRFGLSELGSLIHLFLLVFFIGNAADQEQS